MIQNALRIRFIITCIVICWANHLYGESRFVKITTPEEKAQLERFYCQDTERRKQGVAKGIPGIKKSSYTQVATMLNNPNDDITYWALLEDGQPLQANTIRLFYGYSQYGIVIWYTRASFDGFEKSEDCFVGDNTSWDAGKNEEGKYLYKDVFTHFFAESGFEETSITYNGKSHSVLPFDHIGEFNDWWENTQLLPVLTKGFNRDNKNNRDVVLALWRPLDLPPRIARIYVDNTTVFAKHKNDNKEGELEIVHVPNKNAPPLISSLDLAEKITDKDKLAQLQSNNDPYIKNAAAWGITFPQERRELQHRVALAYLEQQGNAKAVDFFSRDVSNKLDLKTKYYYIYAVGPAGVGKSTLSAVWLESGIHGLKDDYVIIDIDEIKLMLLQMIAIEEGKQKEQFKAEKFDSVHAEAAIIADVLRSKLMENFHIWFETTFQWNGLLKEIDQIKKTHEVILLAMNADAAVCMQRAHLRSFKGGRKVPEAASINLAPTCENIVNYKKLGLKTYSFYTRTNQSMRFVAYSELGIDCEVDSIIEIPFNAQDLIPSIKNRIEAAVGVCKERVEYVLRCRSLAQCTL